MAPENAKIVAKIRFKNQIRDNTPLKRQSP
jgi:hypothetical protein